MSHPQTNRPSTPRIGCLLALALLAALVPAIFATESRAATPPALWESCNFGSATAQCYSPGGVVADPDDGHVYVADVLNDRVQEFTAWGEFVRAFGWDVAPEGAPGDTPADGLETCTATCQAGSSGAGAGQLHHPQGLALDSSGRLYVADVNNNRVQKFDPTGPDVAFEWMIGGGVNQGGGTPANPGNLCTATHLANGDTCDAGGEGPAPAQFTWGYSGPFIALDANGTPATSDDTVYVGDIGRIQRFDTAGAYLSEIPLPGERVTALATDPSGDLYAAFCVPGEFGPCSFLGSKPDVHKLSPAGTPICTLAVDQPGAIAAGPSGEVYVASNTGDVAADGGHQIVKFDAGTCAEVDRFPVPRPAGETGQTTYASNGIATSSACGIAGHDLYDSIANNAYAALRAFGPAPDPGICPPPSVPPTVADQFALRVGTEDATVRAQINPHFWSDATYYLQYGPADCSLGGCAEQPLAPGDPLTEEAASFPVPVDVHLAGLAPDTTYHYRFVTESSGGGPAFGSDKTFTTFAEPDPPNTNCPNQAFRIGPGAQLPDCRAYEMVSPLDKSDSDISPPSQVHDLASPDGERLTFSTKGAAFAEPEAAPLAPQYLSSRDPGAGWRTRAISAPRRSVSFYPVGDASYLPFKAFSTDLCTAWFLHDSDPQLDPAAPTSYPNLYRRDNCTPDAPSFAAITTVAPPGWDPGPQSGSGFYSPTVQGFSADGETTAFRAPAKLTPEASAKDIYQTYAGRDGELRLVSVLPNGTAAAAHSSVGTAYGLAGLSFDADSVYHAVSADGSRIYWTASVFGDEAPAHGGSAFGDQRGHLYVRVDPDPNFEGDDYTADVSGPLPNARFLSATASGSTALFSACPSYAPESGGKFSGFGRCSAGADLYSFDLDSETRTQIAAGVMGVLGASEDLSRVYLVSSQALDAGASASEPNLYLYEGGEFTFIATVSELDAADLVSITAIAILPSPLHREPSGRTSRVSPDGLHLAFTSDAALSGAENIDATSGLPDTEVFVYDAEENELHCASCNRSGARPAGRAVKPLFGDASTPDLGVAATIPGWIDQLHAGNVLAEDGSRLFFESTDVLTPLDTNDKQDVYQWEEEGAGDCDAADVAFDPAAGGCVSLISSGKSDRDSSFVDASSDGQDVFIHTAESLVASDPDFADLYDARIAGGFPPPPPPGVPCDLDAGACEGAGAAAAAPGTGAGAPSSRGPPTRARTAAPRRAARKASAGCARGQGQLQEAPLQAQGPPAPSQRQPEGATMTRTRLSSMLAAVVAAGALWMAPGAQADFGFQSTGAEFANADTSAATAAGSHPFAFTTEFAFNTVVDPHFGIVPEEDLKDILVTAPAGFILDPSATPTCSSAVFQQGGACPIASTVGRAVVAFGNSNLPSLIYNLTPPPAASPRSASPSLAPSRSTSSWASPRPPPTRA